MKARIALLVEKWFPREVFLELVNRGFSKIGEKTWIVPVDRVEEFEKITGVTIEPSETDLARVSGSRRTLEVIKARVERKGSSQDNGFEIIRGEGVYHVIVPSQDRVFKIPAEIVDAYYDVVKELREKGVKRIKKRELVAEALKRIGYKKYFSRDGSRFYWEAFYGDRTRYHTHYYFPAKILEAKGLIKVTQQDEVIIL